MSKAKKIRKFIAVRLIALMMVPYSANAAAACHTPLDYKPDAAIDGAYETVAYKPNSPTRTTACQATAGALVESQGSDLDLKSLSGAAALSL